MPASSQPWWPLSVKFYIVSQQQWLLGAKEWSPLVTIINSTASTERASADGLLPNTTYRYFLAASDGVGTSKPGKALVIHTLDQGVCVCVCVCVCVHVCLCL